MIASLMKSKSWGRMIPAFALAAAVAGVSVWAADGEKIDPSKNRVTPQWQIHDMKRPKPVAVDAGTASTQEQTGKPPSDAVVLFDGTNHDQWKGGKWKIENGYMEVAQGGLETKEQFGDMQLHVEWASPNPPKGNDQGRGNSGVYIMGRYEVQVLDSFKADTYADGQASAIYGQNPPLVNSSRPPGQWQTYDIVWRGPRWDKDGKLTRPANITVFHNGVLTQDHYTLSGPSGHHAQPPYEKHGDKGPISLQNHGSPVRYRSIWLRPLPDLGPVGQKIDEAPAAAAGAIKVELKIEKSDK